MMHFSERTLSIMKKLRFLLFLLLFLCLCTTAFAVTIPGQQSISSITDENGYVSSLTDDDPTTAWTKSSAADVDLTLTLYRGTVGEIWLRNGYAYTQNWYSHYDRPGQVKVTVYYNANQYTTSYDTYRYTLVDQYRSTSMSANWNSGYQRLLLPKKYTGVTKIELTIENVISGFGHTGATISDIIVAAGSHATATPRAYSTSTPKPYVVYVTPTPGPDDDPLVEFITPRPTATAPLVELITPRPTATPKVEAITPEPVINYPSKGGVIGYSNQRIPTRHGPSLSFSEPGSFFQAGQQVKVISKVWDDNNELWWYQIEFQSGGEWYRAYTTDSRIDVDASKVPVEPQWGDPLDNKKVLTTHKIYYGPGEEYKLLGTLVVDNRCDVYMIEDGWVQIEYMDYAIEMKRRGWVPLSVLYAN